MPTLGTRVSDNYQFTILDLSDSRLAELRDTIKKFNKCKLTDYHHIGGLLPIKYRVIIRARYGKNNSAYSRAKSCPMSAGSRFDVYVHRRY